MSLFYRFIHIPAVKLYVFILTLLGLGHWCGGYWSMQGLIPVPNLDCPKVWQTLLPINHYGTAPQKVHEGSLRQTPPPTCRRAREIRTILSPHPSEILSAFVCTTVVSTTSSTRARTWCDAATVHAGTTLNVSNTGKSSSPVYGPALLAEKCQMI